MKRPISLGILGWFMIVTSAISLVELPLSLRNPLAVEMLSRSLLPVWATLAVGCVSALFNIVSGIGVLKGHAWSRTLYVAVAAIGLVVSGISTPFKGLLIPGVVLLAIFSFFLYRPAATAYFHRADA
ncbi:hypothetical protein [Paraburkholderia megapolitana]|uniref:DoxX-like family protein n=1 Tax=Paraburkholderia megapolitana TaxID=420953 RepID=A0A1I3SET6_9BURK|nr:hypothetical protein [Paraburkholderia megapolitana]QDQ85732.1 hypothetical protein FNZ07_32640 [Paraburkholderia megapolitana]SFJ57255.1 hypothetical protein SAMN05192543_108180 [Paraburkholderia megapolitana]